MCVYVVLAHAWHQRFIATSCIARHRTSRVKYNYIVWLIAQSVFFGDIPSVCHVFVPYASTRPLHRLMLLDAQRFRETHVELEDVARGTGKPTLFEILFSWYEEDTSDEDSPWEVKDLVLDMVRRRLRGCYSDVCTTDTCAGGLNR